MPYRQETLERSQSPVRRQRACAPCSKAKARCNFESNRIGDGCYRCRRMDITCTPQMTKSLRRPRQIKSESYESIPTTPAPHNYGGLLVAGPFGISGEKSSDDLAVPAHVPAVVRRSNSDIPTTLNDPHGYSLALPTQNHIPIPRHSLPNALAKAPANPGFGLTWGHAEQALSDFKLKFAPYWPFVVIDPDISAQQILCEKPLLFRSIMLAAGRLSLAKQKEFKRSISAYIGQHVLVMEERDLGLLQGLLVFIAWADHNFFMDQQITHLTYLAIGYGHSLGITRPPRSSNQKLKVATNPKDVKEAMVGQSLTTVLEESPTPEEQRAFLGCIYLLSLNSSQFGRRNELTGEYVNHCLETLTRSAESEQDFVLEKMVRFQQITERISESLPALPDLDHTEAFTLSTSSEMQSIRTQLDLIFENVAKKHRQFTTFWTSHSYVLVRLYLPATYLSPSTDEVTLQHQLKCMQYCLKAAKSFFTTVLSMNIEGIFLRTFASFAEILFVMIAASRLLLLEVQGWDLVEARRTLDFPAILESLISAFKSAISLRNQRAAEAAATFGIMPTPDNLGDEKDDRFYTYIKKLQGIKSWFETELSRGSRSPVESSQQADGPNGWSREIQPWNQFTLGLLGNESWDFDF
ncbi:hypothetical protein F5B20DRAFT_520336 [Whalleya microplaca]|nr:hypothetical protein F5B20DRAFT_520336 [Whalleya microplaca]